VSASVDLSIHHGTPSNMIVTDPCIAVVVLVLHPFGYSSDGTTIKALLPSRGLIATICCCDINEGLSQDHPSRRETVL
jgi:hypothetical protein